MEVSGHDRICVSGTRCANKVHLCKYESAQIGCHQVLNWAHETACYCSHYELVQEKPENRSKTVMVVGSDEDLLFLTRVFLTHFGYEVDIAGSASEALAKFNPSIHDVVLTDELSKTFSGVEMAHVIKLRSPATPVVMYAQRALDNCSAVDVLIKEKVHLLAIKDAIDSVFAG